MDRPCTVGVMTKPTAVIFDVDGTILDVTSALHFLYPDEGGVKDYDSYHKATIDCPAQENVLAAIQQAHADGHAAVMLTSRAERFRADTMAALDRHGVTCTVLHMRRNGDPRIDYEMKAEALDGIEAEYAIVGAWDDNPGVVAMMRARGIDVTHVPGWEEQNPTLVALGHVREAANETAA